MTNSSLQVGLQNLIQRREIAELLFRVKISRIAIPITGSYIGNTNNKSILIASDRPHFTNQTLISQRVGKTNWTYDSSLVNSGNYSFPDPEGVHIEHRSGFIAPNGLWSIPLKCIKF